MSHHLSFQRIHLNHVEMAAQSIAEEAADPRKAAKMKRYHLATAKGRIWRSHRASPFADVIGALQEELPVLQYREQKLGVLKASVADGVQSLSPNGTDATSALTNTIK